MLFVFPSRVLISTGRYRCNDADIRNTFKFLARSSLLTAGGNKQDSRMHKKESTTSLTTINAREKRRKNHEDRTQEWIVHRDSVALNNSNKLKYK